MKLSRGIILVMFSLVLVYSNAVAEKYELKDEKDKVSYSVGHQIGTDFKRQGVELNEKAMLKGVKDGLNATGETLMSEEEMQATLIALKKRIEASDQKAKQEKVDEDLAEGAEFLAANAKKEGTVVLENGLQYQVIKEGNGITPEETDTVQAYYKTTLIDGTEIGSSTGQTEPKTFKVANTIRGLKQALLLMSEGAKWKIFIPPHLAFGKEPNTPMAGKTVIFDIELTKIIKKAD